MAARLLLLGVLTTLLPAARADRSAPEVLPVIRLILPRYQLTAGEHEIVAACLVLEAASLGEFGMRGVMAVIRNRARGRPELFASMVLQPRQFTSLNPQTTGRVPPARAIQRARRDPTWPLAVALVTAAADLAWHDPTGGATHFTRTGEWNTWNRRLTATTVIGRHTFFR